MSSRDSTWKKLMDAVRFRGTSNENVRDPRLEELMGTAKRSKTKGAERLEPSATLLKRCELLYRLDPIIFSGVNRLTRRITASKIYFVGGDEGENTKAYQFLVDSNALALFPLLVKDAFIYGFGVAEISKDKKTKKVSLAQIDPKEFDFKRDPGTKEILFDEEGKVKGYTWKKDYPHTQETVDLKPDEVLIIRFYTLGDYCLGISPIETAFKTAWLKLNLEESLGEAIYRHGFPLFKFKIGTSEPGPFHEITPEKIKDAKKIISALDPSSELVLPWWIDADVLMKRSEIGNITLFLENLGSQILAALEVPKYAASEAVDFEKTIISFQEDFTRQVNLQLLSPYFQDAKYKSIPVMTFSEYAPELQNMKLRRLSIYAKYGLISRTDDLENELRRAEGFRVLQKKETTTNCVLGLGECPVRKEEPGIPIDRLQSFCNICIKRIEADLKVRGTTSDVGKTES